MVALFFLLCSFWLSAQNTNQNYRRALRSLENGNYVEARDRFEAIFDNAENKNEIASYLSECYLALHQEEDIKSLVASLEAPDDYNLYDLALAYYYDEKFDSAAQVAGKIGVDDGLDPQILQLQIENSTRFYGDEEGILIQNFGDEINSDQREYCSVMYNDYNTLLFTSRGESNDNAAADGMAFESIYLTTVDSVGDWTKPVPVKSSIENDRRHDAPVQIINNGTTMISFHDGKLYKSTLNEDTWERSSEIELNTNQGVVTHCYITEDEKTIFFSSDLKLPGADLDLYRSDLQLDGSWSDPVPLAELNTQEDEDAPFIAKDGKFYFSSRGHGSIGGYDVFETVYDSTSSTWSKPKNLGYPINTVDEDIYYSMEGKVGYISSTRNESNGSLDIFRVFLFNKVKVKGTVEDSDGEPIPDVRVDFEYDSSRVYAYTDIDGIYELFLPINTQLHVTFIKDSLNLYEGDYIVNVTFKDKNQNEFSFAITEDEAIPTSEISYRVPKGLRKIPIDVKNDFADNPILASVPKRLEKQWVDSVAQVVEEAKLKREEEARMLEQAQAKEEVVSSVDEKVNTPPADPSPPSVPTDSPRSTEKEEELPDTTTRSVYFGVNRHAFAKTYQSTLNQLVLEIRKTKDRLIYINGYTDYTGPTDYNLKLSFRRARAVYDYLVEQGVDRNKLRIQALGEIDGSDNLAAKRKVDIKWQSDE